MATFFSFLCAPLGQPIYDHSKHGDFVRIPSLRRANMTALERRMYGVCTRYNTLQAGRGPTRA